MWRLLVVGLSSLVVASCASSPEQVETRRSVEELPLHPLAIAVEVEQIESGDSSGVAGEEGSTEPLPASALVDRRNRGDICDRIVRELERQNTFSKVVNLHKPESGGDDVEGVLTVRVRQSTPESIGEPERGGLVWASSSLWFVVGFASWFIADVAYDPHVSVEYRLDRRQEAAGEASPASPDDAEREKVPPLLSGRIGDAASPIPREVRSLDFTQRASGWDYALQLVWPPGLISADEETADQSLYDKYTQYVAVQIAAAIRAQLDSTLRDREEEPYLSVRQEGADLYRLELRTKALLEKAYFGGEDANPLPFRRAEPADPGSTFDYNVCDLPAEELRGAKLRKLYVVLEGRREPWTWTLRFPAGRAVEVTRADAEE